MGKMEKPVVVPICYEEPDEEDIKMVPRNNDSNGENSLLDSDNHKKGKKEEETFSEPKINDELQVTPETTLNLNVVRAIKNYNLFQKDSIKIM